MTNIDKVIKLFTGLLLVGILLSGGGYAFAECESSLELQGTISVDCCKPIDKCASAGEAVYKYMDAIKDEPTVLTIGLQASPWHLYDHEMRILRIEELARMIKPQLKDPVKRVQLVASWTGVAPEHNGKSIAERLSSALGGFPVSGMDGFLWIAKDGSLRTTKQAFTLKRKCPYGVHPDEEVMVSLVAGWPIEFEEDYVKKQNSDGIMRVGAGYDIYMLCQDKALQAFEAAAKLSNPIAAYNAAMIHLERGKKSDLAAASSLLLQAVAIGDKKAKVMLGELKLSVP
jgi:hypothetical protein